jgi:predicted MFS family arabinose efflux permease
MRLTPYRTVLALPGVRALMLVALVARVPATAAGVSLTLHVVLDLHGTYAAAGLLGAVFTVAAAVGAPLLGRLTDRSSLRAAVATCLVAEVVFWATAPVLPFAALVVSGGLLGLLTLPVFSIVRQSIAALVPPGQRRQAYALDSMGVELSFMVGPTSAVLLVTRVSAVAALYAVGIATVLAGIGLYALNPPTRSADEVDEPAERPARRSWLRPQFVGLLAISAATTAILAGTDLSLVATLRASHEVAWIGALAAIWGVYSLVGGFIYGAVRWSVPTVVLFGLLGVLTVPIGLAGGAASLAVALIPAGILCAPTLAAAADGVSRLVPGAARGEAMGLHNSAMTLGLAGGAPLAGAVIDASSPGWGFVAAGGCGAAIALALLPVVLRGNAATAALDGPPRSRRPGHEAVEDQLQVRACLRPD